MLPATKAMPKEMLPVVDKPIIQYAFEEARAAGIEHFIFVTGRGKSVDRGPLRPRLRARGHAGAGRQDGRARRRLAGCRRPGELSYTRQQEPLGLGHAVWCARHLVGNEPFAVLLVDDLVMSDVPCLQQMVEALRRDRRQHRRGRGGAARAHQSLRRARPGSDDGRLVEVRGLVEKPDPAEAPSRLAIIGRYILLPEVFEHLDRQQKGAGGEIQLTDAMAG